MEFWKVQVEESYVCFTSTAVWLVVESQSRPGLTNDRAPVSEVERYEIEMVGLKQRGWGCGKFK